jgi:hypothetical protein
MSIKTLSKRIALVAVSALGFGLLSVVTAPVANACAATNFDGTKPIKVLATAFGAATCGTTTLSAAAIAAKQLSGADNFVTLEADTDAAAGQSIIKVTGSTIRSSSVGTVAADLKSVLFGDTTANTLVDGNTIVINTPTAGTITVTYSTRAVTNGVVTDTVTQTITVTVVDKLVVSAAHSFSIIDDMGTANAGASTNGEINGVWSSQPDGTDGSIAVPLVTSTVRDTDDVVYAPKGTCSGSSGTTPCNQVATVNIALLSSADTLLNSTTGLMPTLRAVVRGPGNVGWNGQYSMPGRDMTWVATTFDATPTLDVYQDGTAGISYVDIYVNGTLWSTETLYFYGAATSAVATQSLYIAPTPTSAAGAAFGCGSGWSASGTTGLPTVNGCAGTSIASTPAATIALKDAAGVAVPYATLTATSSDTTVFASSTTAAMSPTVGTYNANISTVAGTTSGKTAAITWAVGTTATSNALTYAIGGPAASAKLTAAAGPNVGDKGTLKLEKFDAAGNKAADAYHTVALSSNVSITASIFTTGSVTQTGESITVSVLNGVREWTFFNPLVPSSVTLSGTVDALLPVSTSFSVSNAALDAALDAANEAIDAANAATDAANLAAEAADAATVAAEEARDAADAATAAVEALATEVATLMAALKAQLTTLANTVAKISKRLKK